MFKYYLKYRLHEVKKGSLTFLTSLKLFTKFYFSFYLPRLDLKIPLSIPLNLKPLQSSHLIPTFFSPFSSHLCFHRAVISNHCVQCCRLTHCLFSYFTLSTLPCTSPSSFLPSCSVFLRLPHLSLSLTHRLPRSFSLSHSLPVVLQ